MTYQVSKNIDSNKIFLINRSEIEGRLEAEYYKPSIAIWENKIRKQSTKKLSDYVITMAGGATPKTDNEDYYSDENNGVVFLRVQNLQTTGEITKENCKFIAKKIHDGLLKRSQVAGGDLLIKITGVGRMAVASVAPEGFIGNINQHLVVVKTQSKTISHYLARYLNLDIIEKIASRHTTGGTRPALDYSALRSIPIIEGINFNIIDNAIEIAKQKNKEARDLLDSIDDYILNELGITLPKQNEVDTKDIPAWMDTENLLVKNGRLFVTSFKEVVDNRIDPKIYSWQVNQLKHSIAMSKYKCRSLLSIVCNVCSGDWGIDANNEDTENSSKYTKCLVIRSTEFDNQYNLRLDNNRAKYRLIDNKKLLQLDLQKGDILFEKSGGSPDQPVGRVAILTDEILNSHDMAFSNFISKMRIIDGICPEYVFDFLKTAYNIRLTDAMQSQTNGIRNLIARDYFCQDIPIPPIDKQKSIALNIQEIREQAKNKSNDSIKILNEANFAVERIILGS
jgi:type I restriction enzyme, S subunit